MFQKQFKLIFLRIIIIKTSVSYSIYTKLDSVKVNFEEENVIGRIKYFWVAKNEIF